MEDRFVEFTIAISKLNKLVQKLKTDRMKSFELKGVYTLCMYQLLLSDGGLTSTEIAVHCDLDPALVSRTLGELLSDGIIQKANTQGKKYYMKYYLSDKGKEISYELMEIIHQIQEQADDGIQKDELAIFYKVLNKLIQNFESISRLETK